MADANSTADIQAKIDALVPPGAATGAPAFKLDTPDKEAKARAALVEVGVRDRSPEMEYLIETGKVNAAPIAARIGRGRPKAPKPDPSIANELTLSRLTADHPELAPKLQKYGATAAPTIEKMLLQQDFGAEKAKPFTLDRSKMSPEDQAATQNLSDADTSQYFKEKLGRSDKSAQAIKTVEALKQRFPQYAEQLDALKDTPEAIPNIMSSLYSREFTPEKPVKPEPFRIDRSHLPPGLAKYAPYMSDEQIGGLAAADYKTHQTQGGNPPGFKGLTIVQDARFKRSGLRTGDTVCIKIP